MPTATLLAVANKTFFPSSAISAEMCTAQTIGGMKTINVGRVDLLMIIMLFYVLFARAESQ